MSSTSLSGGTRRTRPLSGQGQNCRRYGAGGKWQARDSVQPRTCYFCYKEGERTHVPVCWCLHRHSGRENKWTKMIK